MEYEQELQDALIKIHKAKEWHKFNIFQFPSEFWGDSRFVLAMVKRDGWLLGNATEEVRDMKDVCLAAVKNCGWALQFVSERLREDEEIVTAAVKQDVSSISFTSQKYQEVGAYEIIEKSKSKTPISPEDCSSGPFIDDKTFEDSLDLSDSK